MIIGNTKDANALILLPSYEEEDLLAAKDEGAWFEGVKGKFLKSAIKLDQFCVAHAVGEVLYEDEIVKGKTRNPTFQELEDSTERINKLVKDSNCDTIFLTGAALAKLLIHDTIKLSASVGKKFTIHIGGKERTVIPNFDAGYVHHKKSSLIPEFRQIFSRSKPINIEDFYEVLNPKEAIKNIKRTLKLYKQGLIDHIIFDTETTSLNAHEGELIMYSWAHDLDPKGYSVPLTVQNKLPDSRNFQVLLPPEEYEESVLVEAKERKKDKKKLKEDHLHALLQEERSERKYTFEPIDMSVSESEKEKLNYLVGEMISTIPIVGHNLKFDVVFCHYHQIAKNEEIKIKDDTLAMAFQIFGKGPKGFGGLSLKNLAKKFCDVPDNWEFEVHDWLSKFPKVVDRHFGNIPTKILGKYAALDAYYNKQVYAVMRRMLKPSMREITDLVTEVTHAFVDCETQGTMIDQDIKSILEAEYLTRKERLDSENKKMPVVERFLESEYGRLYQIDKLKRKNSLPNAEKIRELSENLNSFLKLREILYGPTYYGLPILEDFKTKKGAPETGLDLRNHFIEVVLTEDNLQSLEDSKAAPMDKIKKFREARKFLENYNQFKRMGKLLDNYLGEALEKQCDNGRLMPNFKHMNGTTSGRCSSGFHTVDSWSDIKRLYTSRWRGSGGIFVAPDFSQLELRIAGCVSGDKNLLRAYVEGIDIHKMTASKIFECKIEDVTHEQRQTGKIINFSILYGKTASGLADDLRVSREVAEEYIESFFNGFPGLKKYFAIAEESIRKKGTITTKFGRVIPVEDWDSKKRSSVNRAVRSGCNATVQSAASDCVLWTINESYKQHKKEELKSIMVATVHDSLEYDVYPGELFRSLKTVRDTAETKMAQNIGWISCPITLGVEIGCSWGGSVEVEIEKLTSCEFVGSGEGLRCDINNLVKELKHAYRVELEILEEFDMKEKNIAYIVNDITQKFRITIRKLVGD